MKNIQVDNDCEAKCFATVVMPTHFNIRSISIEHHGDTLQDPVTDVKSRLEICLHDEADTHGIGSQLGDVDRRLDRASELQLVRLDWNDLHERHLFDEHLGLLVVQGVLLSAPSRAFNVQALHVCALFQSLGDLSGIEDLGDIRVHCRLVQSPSFGSAGGLDQSRAVRLWNGETREPDDFRLFDIDPVTILLKPAFIMSNPVDKVLLRLRRQFSPDFWQLTVEEGCAKRLKISAHTDLTLECSLKIDDGARHSLCKLVESLKLLQQYGLRWRDDVVERLTDVVLVEELWQSVCLDALSNFLDDILTVDAA